MKATRQEHVTQESDGCILDAIPSPDEIRREIAANTQRNRVLRSLYRVSQRLEQVADSDKQKGGAK